MKKDNSKGEIRALVCRILLILYVFAVAYLCFANFKHLPDIPRTILGIPADKIVHFLMFFPFPILGFLSVKKRFSHAAELIAAIVTIWAIGCIFAGCTEMIQGTMKYRTEDIKDFYADMIAMSISSLFIPIINRILK